MTVVPEMFERAGERLLDLGRDRGLRVIGQAMILPIAKRELGLQEQIVARHQAARDRCRNAPTNGRLVVVASLVGGVDAAKALLQRQLRSAAAVSSSFHAVP